MAFASHTAHSHTGFAGTLDTLRARLVAWVARRAVYTQTYNELSALNNRELADLGISRSEIKYIAREAADQA